MRMLVVTEAYLPRIGGGVRYEVDLVNYFRAKGHTVDVVTIGDQKLGSVEKQEKGNVFRLGKHLQFDSARLSASMISFMLRRVSSYDLVHFNAPNPMGELAYYLTRHVRPEPSHTVCFYHGEVISEKRFARQYNNWLLPAHLRNCERIVVSSPNFARTSDILRAFAHKVQIIPFGIDTQHFSPMPDWTAEIPNRPLRFLFVGRLVRYKGLFVLIDAFKQVKGTLEIVGDGPLRDSLEEFVKECGLKDRVIFQGRVTDEELLRCYQNADVFVLPSIDRGESFGYVLAEAMACGACAISTELGTGTSYVNSNGETGLVVKPKDVDALADAMNMLSRDRDLAESFRSRARQRIRRLFSRNRMLQKTSEMHKLLGIEL